VITTPAGPARPTETGEPRPGDTVWIDLHAPTIDEEHETEALLGVDLPTREDIESIEPSSRLYIEDGALFMTASVICKSEGRRAETTDVAFILVCDKLVTVRYGEPKAFSLFAQKARRNPDVCRNGITTLVNLLEAVVDRTAEVLEKTDDEVDALPDMVFSDGSPKRRTTADLEATIVRIGILQRRTAKIRDSLVSLGRAVGFLLTLRDPSFDAELKSHVKSLARDIASLSDHTSYTTANIAFLLDATLGLINIEQNGIIKFFSVVAVVLLPPTLVGTVYGMNFEIMPELQWSLGYPFAIFLMVISAVVPYLWFRRLGWL
jgi:magnesium transporter